MDPWLEPIGKASGSVGGGYSVELTVWRYGLQAEWDPAVPRHLTRKQMRQYKRIRHEALEAASKAFGVNVLVIDA